MMKTRLTFIPAAFLLSAAFTLVACGNNNDEISNTAGITPDGKVDVARSVEFRVNFGGYNDDDEIQGTRAARAENGDTLSREYVELGNGLLAEVTVQKDTDAAEADAQAPVTRALTDGTYTMLAYNRNGEYKGMVTGTVSGGVFTATPGTADGIVLVPDTYDFVLFNSKVTRNGNNLTVTRANAATALIGRTTYAVTESPVKQKVTFDMKHAGSRMRIKLTGHMDIKAGTAATLSSVDAASVPGTSVYNAATGTWSNGTTAAISGEALTFPASTEALYTSCSYTSNSKEYMYLLPLTNPSKLRLRFTGGNIYRKDMKDAQLTLSVPTLQAMQANGSYVINVRLKYNFLYLMSDGTTGLFRETKFANPQGTKTPIGVVVRKKTATEEGLAVALKDANGGAKLQWYKTASTRQHNYRMFNTGEEVQSYNDMDGYKYTWESNATGGGSPDIKATKQTDYPAFYYAGHYGDELKASSITVSGSIKDKKWHLPSAGEWKYVFTSLGFGDGSAMTAYSTNYNWFGCLAGISFTQAGGTAPYANWYWSSSEATIYRACYVYMYQGYMGWSTPDKDKTHSVRAFIKF